MTPPPATPTSAIDPATKRPVLREIDLDFFGPRSFLPAALGFGLATRFGSAASGFDCVVGVTACSATFLREAFRGVMGGLATADGVEVALSLSETVEAAPW